MAYNRRNILLRIIQIQEFTLEQTTRGVTQEFVYNNHVFPTYRISRRTFYSYLAINAKAEIKRIENNRKLQMSLFQ
jgi:hypothetical protein